MTERIIAALKRAGIENYTVRMVRERSSEMFFIRRRRDMTRAKDVTKYEVTVYRDFEADGKAMRGAASAGVFDGMTDGEMESALKDAYYAAQFVKNPFYELADPVVGEDMCEEADLAGAAQAMADALYKADGAADTFINSAEIFAVRQDVRVVNSRGVDVKYARLSFKGEFVAQCAYPQDVEIYKDFEYDRADTEAIYRLAEQTISAARDRSRAKDAPRAGDYAMVITGRELATILSAYVEKSDASMIYAGYSNFKIGCEAQGADVTGEKINMTLKARAPYSIEGVPMVDRPLMKDGALQTIHGNTRFCRYLGVEPTGSYMSAALDAGSMSVEEMKNPGCIYPVTFSDFQMDPFTGYFGGEIRLAYVFDEDGMHVVTGGSVSGSLFEAQKDIKFSTERYSSAEYEGPFAALIGRVSVAGA